MGHYRSLDGSETWSAFHTDEELEAEHKEFEAKCAAELPGRIERGRKLSDVEQTEQLPEELSCSPESMRCRRIAVVAHDIVCHVARDKGLAATTDVVVDQLIQQGRWIARGDYDKLGYGSKVHAQAAALATEAIRASLFDPITLAPKKLIRTRRASEGSASEPSLARRVSMCKDAKLSCRGNRGMCCGVLEHIHEWLSRTDPESAEEYRAKEEVVAELRDSTEWQDLNLQPLAPDGNGVA
jgi:hypothetical protein